MNNKGAVMLDNSKENSYLTYEEKLKRETYSKDEIDIIKNGEEIKYYENGKICSKASWKDGKLHGEEIKYFRNGKISHKTNWINGKPHGEEISYYDNGEISSKTNRKNGKLHGEEIIFDEDKCIIEKNKWLEDKKISEISYYKNGVIYLKKNFKNGDLDGEYECNLYYHVDNNKIHKGGERKNYKNGKLHGEYTSYSYSDNILRSRNV